MSKFKELRQLDVSEHIEKKGKFNYLSWTWAVDTLLQQDPSATWEFKEPVYFAETVMVFCSVTAFGKTMTCQMPVLNHTNRAIANPNAMDVNTAMQRCLVKAIALHGIGLYIYAGEDLPEVEIPLLHPAQLGQITKLLESTATDVNKILAYYKKESLEQLNTTEADQVISSLQKKLK